MKVKSILIGSVVMFFVIFIILLIMAALMYFTELDEGVVSAGVYAGAGLGVLAGAWYAAKKSESKALLHALSVSLIFVAALVGASFAVHRGITVNAHFFAMPALAAGTGFLGAILGRS